MAHFEPVLVRLRHCVDGATSCLNGGDGVPHLVGRGVDDRLHQILDRGRWFVVRRVDGGWSRLALAATSGDDEKQDGGWRDPPAPLEDRHSGDDTLEPYDRQLKGS